MASSSDARSKCIEDRTAGGTLAFFSLPVPCLCLHYVLQSLELLKCGHSHPGTGSARLRLDLVCSVAQDTSLSVPIPGAGCVLLVEGVGMWFASQHHRAAWHFVSQLEL